MKRKVLFFVMAFAMSAFFVPNVSAAGDVAKIGETKYATLQEAITAAGAGDTVTLLQDTAEDITVASGKDLTLDLGGFTLKNVSDHTITNSGKLTITGTGTVDNVTHEKAALYNNQAGVVVIDGGTFERSAEAGESSTSSGGNSYYTIQNLGTMTVNDATVKNNGKYSSMFENGWYDGSKNVLGTPAKLTINGGTFSGGINTIKNDDFGVIEINDGTFGSVVQAILLNWNEATVNGGTFETDKSPVVLNGKINDTMDKGILTINGGTFTAGTDKAVVREMTGAAGIGSVEINDGTFANKLFDVITDGEANLVVNGGTFTVEPSEENIPEGFKVFENEDGTYMVAEPVLVTLTAPGYEDASSEVELPKGVALTAEEVELLKEALMEELKDSGLEFLGFFSDEDLTVKYDMTTAFSENVTIYLGFGETENREEDKTNPDTSDINLILILGTLLIGGAGLGFTLKNRKFN